MLVRMREADWDSEFGCDVSLPGVESHSLDATSGSILVCKTSMP